MFKKILFTTLLFVGYVGNVQAQEKDTLNCVFTEPFFSISYSPNNGLVVYQGVDGYQDKLNMIIPRLLTRNGDFVESRSSNKSGYPMFQLVDRTSGGVIIELELTLKASDGMTDLIYPYSAKYKGFVGACSTDRARAFNPDKLIEGLAR